MMTFQEIISAVNGSLYKATTRFAEWLYRAFKKNENYWYDYVLGKLSDNQKMIIESKGFSELTDLDLAALLRIADRNWYELLRINSDLSNADRDTLRAISGIRNRWAHCGATPLLKEQILADLYAIRDFFKIIGIDANAKSDIRDLIRSVSDDSAASIETLSSFQKKESFANAGSIDINSLVRLKSDTKKTGVVMSILPIENAIKYRVFVDGAISEYFAEQIELLPDSSANISTIEDLLRTMTARQLCPPSSNNLFSLNSARIDFVPYQFRPALKIIKLEPPRLLIADGVGVGKTIEAGLIIKELAARSPLETIIIICPRPLIAEKKWEREMREKFGEDFVAADSSLLRQLIKDCERDGEWNEKYNRLMIPYSILNEELLYGKKGKKAHSGLESLDPPPFFDMLIVDEAHHIRNSNTQAHKVVKYFTEHSNAVLYLTATPIQLGNNDLYTLLNLLFPNIIIDKAVFNAMAEPNEYINAAVKLLRAGNSHKDEARERLILAANTEMGRQILPQNPSYNNLISALSSETEMTRETRIKLIGETENLHSFANIINRTRRQDIEDFCVRRAVTHKSIFTPKQKELHDELLSFIATVMSILNPTITLKFLMCTVRRQAASCIFGLAPFIEEMTTKNLRRLPFDCDEFDDFEDEFSFNHDDFNKITESAKHLIKLSKNLPPEDSKLESLLTILREREQSKSGKTIIFSTFRHTLKYLKKQIKEKSGLRVEVVDGSVKDEERYNLREGFALPRENPNAIDVLLFSEVGSEGLDYQFCDAMVNYDLPWNPMRIEQRIGRIDRRGQKSETVQIFNCITESTIDYEIYERCYSRIDIFEKSLGECSEILGNIEGNIKNIIFDTNLTESERAIKMEAVADNAVRRIEEDARLENEEKDMFGIDMTSFNDDIEKADSPWLSQAAIKHLIGGYLTERLGRSDCLSNEILKLTSDEKKVLFDDYQLLGGKTIDKVWENYMKNSKPNVQISLSSNEAVANRKSIFLTLLHPLVRQAANYYAKNSNMQIALSVSGQDIPQGTHPFSLYAWEYKGYHPHTEFVVLCDDGIDKQELLNSIMVAMVKDSDLSPYINMLAKQELMHLQLWRKAKDDFIKEVNSDCNYKIATLEKSVTARKLLAEQQLSSNTDAKIEIMRKAQIERLENDFETKKQRIQKSADSADIITILIASGIIEVEE